MFALFIVELPSLRAQSIQVVSSLHALAERGRRVRLWFRPTGGDPLAPYGLAPHPNLELCALPASRTLGSLVFRADLARWASEHRGTGVFLARSKRYARFATRVAPHVPLVLEAHEVDSLQHARTDGMRFAALERVVLDRAAGLITNCEGVLEGLSWMHRLPPVTRVVHNAWLPGPDTPASGSGLALAGSLLGTKDPTTVARAARRLGPITVYGPEDPRFPGLVAESRSRPDGPCPPALVRGGPVDPKDLVDTLRRHEILILPLGRGWFGDAFTSPLKAFAYQAARVPFVGADTPALRRAAPGAFEPYEPGDVDGLVEAVESLRDPAVRARRLAASTPRTWAQRAAEVDEVLDAVG
ncbi:MAG: glycosyltransferase [Myxococcota bacterium]